MSDFCLIQSLSIQMTKKPLFLIDSFFKISKLRSRTAEERPYGIQMRRVGRVAMQRIANPFTSVRLRDAPPSIEMEM